MSELETRFEPHPNQILNWKKKFLNRAEAVFASEKKKENPDTALEKTNLKFINQFKKMEYLARSKDQNLSEMTLEEMDMLWEKIKKID